MIYRESGCPICYTTVINITFFDASLKERYTENIDFTTVLCISADYVSFQYSVHPYPVTHTKSFLSESVTQKISFPNETLISSWKSGSPYIEKELFYFYFLVYIKNAIRKICMENLSVVLVVQDLLLKGTQGTHDNTGDKKYSVSTCTNFWSFLSNNIKN